MNCESLLDLLKHNGIAPHDVVAINGDPFLNDIYHIRRADGLWEVYYMERGHRWDYKQFEAESEACDYLWNLLRRDETLWR